MIFFITGGSASGKSEYAGGLAERLAGEGRILYIATLSDRSAESLARIERHRQLRETGCYDVAECFSLDELESTVNNISEDRYGAVLLDSLDGLTADIMFGPGSGGGRTLSDPAGRRTASAVLAASRQSDHLIVVSDYIYSDGTVYDELTSDYMSYTAHACSVIADRADCAIEVICGIPVLLKGENHEFLQIDHHNVFSVHKNTDALHKLGQV